MAPTVLQPPPSKSAVRPKVLVVDDEPTMIELVADVMRRKTDCQLLSARDLREAEAILKKELIDLLLADVGLPDGDGMSLLPKLHTANPAAADNNPTTRDGLFRKRLRHRDRRRAPLPRRTSWVLLVSLYQNDQHSYFVRSGRC